MKNSTAVQFQPELCCNPRDFGSYCILPHTISRRHDISLQAKMVYGYLAGCYGHDGLVCPRVERIAIDTGIGPRQVGKALAELRSRGLVSNTRTGRSSIYYFHPPEDIRYVQPGRSDTPVETDRPAPLPLIENKKEKETAAAVFSDLPECQKAAKEIRDGVSITKQIRKTIRDGIAAHGVEPVIRAIHYTNARSKSNYGGYLGKAISEGWGDSVQAISSAQDPVKHARIEQEAQERLAVDIQKKEELAGTRERAMERFLGMTDDERAEARREFLAQANAFTRRKCARLPMEDLGEDLSFQVWLES